MPYHYGEPSMKHHFFRMVMARARGLPTLSAQPDVRVAIMAPNSPQWAWDDSVILSCDAATAPFYHTDGLANSLYLLNDSGSRRKVAADKFHTIIGGRYLPDDHSIHDAGFLSC
jgi:long-subunit acyl-CoA synthetase (AMP-forming)